MKTSASKITTRSATALLVSARLVAFDTETTGLEVDKDCLVRLALSPMLSTLETFLVVD